MLDGKINSNSLAGSLFGDKEVFNIISSETMSEQEKTDRLTLKGLEFRLNYLENNENLPFYFNDEERSNYIKERSNNIESTRSQIETQRKIVKSHED